MSETKEELGGLKESIEFNEIWWNDVQEGEQICQDEIDLVLEMIAMSKAELEKNASLITTIESQKEEIEKVSSEAKYQVELTLEFNRMYTDISLKLTDKNDEIDSLKAITELAVKGLKEIQSIPMASNPTRGFLMQNIVEIAKEVENTLSEIAKLSHE